MGIEHSTEEQTEYKSEIMRSFSNDTPGSEGFVEEITDIGLQIDRMCYEYEQSQLHPVEKICIKV